MPTIIHVSENHAGTKLSFQFAVPNVRRTNSLIRGVPLPAGHIFYLKEVAGQRDFGKIFWQTFGVVAP